MKQSKKEMPYNDLPLLPPDKKLWETVEVYKHLAKARAALAELKGRCPVIPNPMMLINTLVLQEAKDSSSIENIFTTSDKLYRAFASPKAESDSQTREVLRYRQALFEAWNSLNNKKINSEIIEANELYSYELIEQLFSQPYCKINILVDSGIGSRNTVSKYLNKLADIGILEREQAGNEILYLNKELYKILSSP